MKKQKNSLSSTQGEQIYQALQRDFAAIIHLWENIFLLESWLQYCQEQKNITSNNGHGQQNFLAARNFFTHSKQNYYQYFLEKRSTFREQLVSNLYQFINNEFGGTPNPKEVLRFLKERQAHARMQIQLFFQEQRANVNIQTRVFVLTKSIWMQSPHYQVARFNVELINSMELVPGLNVQLDRGLLNRLAMSVSVIYLGLDLYQFHYSYVSLNLMTVLMRAMFNEIDAIQNYLNKLNCDELTTCLNLSRLQRFFELSAQVGINIALRGASLDVFMQSIAIYFLTKGIYQAQYLIREYFSTSHSEINFLDILGAGISAPLAKLTYITASQLFFNSKESKIFNYLQTEEQESKILAYKT